MFLIINSVLGIVLAVSLLADLPLFSTVLFIYFLCYGILWVLERHYFPGVVRPSDYIEGNIPPLDSIGDGEEESFPDDSKETPPPH